MKKYINSGKIRGKQPSLLHQIIGIQLATACLSKIEFPLFILALFVRHNSNE